MKRLLIGIATVTSLLATSALAADLPVRTYTKAPVYVEPAYDWSGFYIGLNGGYSWGNASNTFTAGTLPVTTASQHMDGWVFGGQAGYNWQFNKSWVFGLEGDIDATGQDGTATMASNTTVTVFPPPLFNIAVLPTRTVTTVATGTFEEKLPWLATFRGRIGVLPTDRVLLYVTGGLAVGEVKSTSSVGTTTTTTLSFGTPPGPTSTSALAGASSTQAGWTIGAGVEGAIGGNWTAKLEYLYVDLGTVNNTFAGTAPFAPLTTSAHVTDNILRAGINYRFGGPVVAKY
ncbi:outer membrane protein [Bradyrhizobium sp.]|jgi:outer membrane immunogenic protein|uniref:outer membrane protein n=1 Tax=Bradyrhizobium sp. TaxID=376 RepID=UPI003D0CFEB6